MIPEQATLPLPPPPPDGPIDVSALEKSLRHPRTFFSAAMSVLTGAMTVLAVVPLVSVLYMVIVRGSERVSLALFTQLPPAAGMDGGGIGNALIGTLLIVTIATLLSVPVGILGAIYLAEFGPETRLAAAVRFAAKVLTGLPSILAGVFAFTVVVLTTGRFSAPAGGLALALLMLPIILLTAEEAIRSVPAKMREAAYGMGATHTQVVGYVVLPTALPGLLTGVMLAVARAAGETAPLLFTAMFFDYWPGRRLLQPTPSMAVLIFNFAGSPFPNQIEIAWAASLVLVVIVLVLNVTAQLLSRRSTPIR
jgi:phosphate transport system permease protein